MKKFISILILFVMLLSMAACSGDKAGTTETKGAENTSAANDKQSAAADNPINRYVEVEEYIDDEFMETSGGTLVLYADGSGVLDFNLSWREAEDVVYDPEGQVLYTVAEAIPYPVELDGDRILVYFGANTLYVFAPEEEGFSMDDIRGDAIEALAEKLSEEDSERAAAFAAILSHPSSEGWVHIRTAEEFLRIADDLSGKYVLDADIDDWSGGISTVFTPIGTPEEPFTGELDGNGHKITGTLAYTGQEEAWGLFGCSEGYIHDLVIGYIWCEEMQTRYIDAWDTERSYAALEDDGLPADSTLYYGVLCGMNRGTLENIRFEDRASVPEMNLYPNENDKVYLGVVCAYNEGTVSGVRLLETDLWYRTFDKDTAADVGLICGYQAADAVLEDVSLELNYVNMDAFGENILFIAPAVNAGLLIGEAEGGTTVRNIGSMSQCDVEADFSLVDADLRLGGLIGCVLGDIEISGIEMEEPSVQMDARDDQEGYYPTASVHVSAGCLIGFAQGNVILTDIRITDCFTQVVRRDEGDPRSAYLGGAVGYCGGDLTARSVTLEGDYSRVDASVERGIAYSGGLCGYCAGAADIEDSHFSLSMSPWFDGSILYTSNVLGYVCGDASFVNVKADCGVDEFSGQSKSNSVMAVSGSTYYLAAFAGAAEGDVDASGCEIDVFWNVFGGGATICGAEETDGLYNPV